MRMGYLESESRQVGGRGEKNKKPKNMSGVL